MDNTTDNESDVMSLIFETPEGAETASDEAETQDEEDVAEVEEPEADDADAEEETAEADDAEDESEAEDDQEPVSALHTVKVDGKPVQVTYDELLRGYSGQAYIQQNLEAISSERKQLAEAAQVLQNERDRILQAAQALESGQMTAKPTPPSKDMLKSDPIGYIEAKAQYDDDMAAYEASRKNIEAMRNEAGQRTQAQHQQMLAEQMDILFKAIPDFADPEKAPALRDKLIAVGTSYGFSDAEMRSQADARYIRVLNDAAKWRDLQAAGKSAAKKADTKTSPVVKPGVKKTDAMSKTRRVNDAAARMRKTGSIDDVAAFLTS